MPYDATVQSDLQADLGINADQSVFTDAELQRLYARGGEDLQKAILIGLRQLWAQSWRFFNWTTGNTSEQRVQVKQGLKEAITYYEGLTGEGGKLSTGSIDLVISEVSDDVPSQL